MTKRGIFRIPEATDNGRLTIDIERLRSIGV